jgi:pimeloyl-ACP methyl ester carboxylesterase
VAPDAQADDRAPVPRSGTKSRRGGPTEPFVVKHSSQFPPGPLLIASRSSKATEGLDSFDLTGAIVDVDLGRPPYGTRNSEVVIDGVPMAYLEAGSGPAIVLLHGNGGSSRDWNGVIPALATRNRVLAPDLPGYGESAQADNSSPTELARRVRTFMVTVGAETAVLVGHSMGGLVALHLALAHPAEVSKLVLVDSAGLGRGLGLPQILYATTFLGKVALVASRLPGGTFVRTLDVALSSTTQTWRIPPSWWIYQLRAGRSRRILATTNAAVKRCVDWSGQTCLVTDRLGELTMPTLIVWGLMDKVIPVWQGVRASRLVRSARLHVFPLCGHAPQVEASEEFLRVMEDFLS